MLQVSNCTTIILNNSITLCKMLFSKIRVFMIATIRYTKSVKSALNSVSLYQTITVLFTDTQCSTTLSTEVNKTDDRDAYILSILRQNIRHETNHHKRMFEDDT